MRHRLIAISFTAALLGAAPAGAQVRLLEAGILCPRESGGERIDAPGTEAGFIRRIDEGLGFDLPDRIVPTMDALGFGFRVGLKPGAPTQAVTVVVTHPPMGPRGVEREEWDDVIVPDAGSLNLFTFEEDYEKVPGPWAFSIEIGGEAVVTVPFTVEAASGSTRIEQACFQFLS